ncbi:MAG: flagellar M-ring protein FliF C-terminal domain-containing protein, partial [Roseibium sp.]
YLVASAVAGLLPDDVSIIDGNGGLISPSNETAPISGAEDKAQFLRDRVQRLLEARVGQGNAVVEVSVETVTESESIRERLFDPEGRVAISSDTQESSTSANDASSGDVTVASNLPDGDAAQGENSSSQNSETREQVNYEVSETERNIVRTPGAVKRLTVAVLVNGSTEIDASGAAVFVPRAEEEMNALRELVSATVGFDKARGDVITLKSMALQNVEPIGTTVTASFLDGIHIDVMSIIQMLVLATVTLILGLFVLRPILANAPALPPPDRTALPVAHSPSTEQTQDASLTALTGEIEDDGYDGANISALNDNGAPAAARIGMSSEAVAEPVERLRAMIGDRQEETVEILRGWLEDREENA